MRGKICQSITNKMAINTILLKKNIQVPEMVHWCTKRVLDIRASNGTASEELTAKSTKMLDNTVSLKYSITQHIIRTRQAAPKRLHYIGTLEKCSQCHIKW